MKKKKEEPEVYRNFIEDLGINCWDNSCPSGWEELVTRLIEDLNTLGWDGELHQVKEKFGTLRFYIGSGTDEIFKRIDQAESESAKVCQTCGKAAKSRTYNGYWVATLCVGCHKKYKNRK